MKWCTRKINRSTYWQMSWRERIKAFWNGSIYLEVLTFNCPLQPLKMSVDAPEIENSDQWQKFDQTEIEFGYDKA